MNFDEYQQRSNQSDKHRREQTLEESYELPSMTIPLLGIIGEAGELVTEYKKRLRRGSAYNSFPERVKEELGDLLWYLSNIATKFELSLDEIAKGNISKIEQRWLGATTDASEYRLFDEPSPPSEQFPRRGYLTITENEQGRAQVWFDGKSLGDSLTDNQHEPDDYRFHDIFHLAYMATLGWSPVIRKLMNRKRKTEPIIDEVEDGARAIIIDETISNFVFLYAKERDFAMQQGVGWQALRMIKGFTQSLEVSARSEGDWETAIIAGFRVWRPVQEARGGVLWFDLDNRVLDFIRPAS